MNNIIEKFIIPLTYSLKDPYQLLVIQINAVSNNKNYDFRSFKIKGVFTPFIFSFRIYKLIQPTRDSLLELIVINL